MVGASAEDGEDLAGAELPTATQPVSSAASEGRGLEEGPDSPEDSGQPAPPWRRRALGAAAVVLIAFGFVGVGVAIGWRVVAHQDLPDTGARFVKVETPDYQAGSTARMPDVRGMREDAARAAVADAGIPVDVVQVSERGAAGQAGVVIEQVPAFGTEKPAQVELVISRKATVPDVIGLAEAEAYAQLRELGPVVEVTRVYRPGADPGVAVGVDPAVGTRLGDSVELLVSEAAASVFLSELDTVDGSCRTGPVDVNGSRYDNSLSCGAGSEPTAVAWVLGRKVDELSGTVGVPDDGPADSEVEVVVFADGKKVRSVRAAYGSTTPLTATLTGALRMEIRVRALNAEEESWGSAATAVLGDARLSGSSGAIDELMRAS